MGIYTGKFVHTNVVEKINSIYGNIAGVYTHSPIQGHSLYVQTVLRYNYEARCTENPQSPICLIKMTPKGPLIHGPVT